MSQSRAKAEPNQSQSTAGESDNGPLAIIAGNGSLPFAVADAALAAGREVHLIGIRGEADEKI